MTQDAGLFIGLLSLGLTVPLAYAGHTLLGLRGTTWIPLLRTRDAAGISHLAILAIPSRSQPPIHRRFV
ncbi:exported hypothetical protein [Nitrospira lenta]|uniref:Uncharacterized protein n=1 Tax=Nitrospira lenta TaxID=1436998 RepID=A0A330L7J5_9BACT|nr:exported hypothetical protein [Nitrospira lenta]